ncbi:MAG: hypothetical protein FWC70_12585 [Defluviitaleaceae bacterium]|nr:hypothetical protein [Defluviitaleaceae bacterium]
MLKKKIAYVFWAMLYAYGIFTMSLQIFVSVGGDPFWATIGNFLMILAFLIVEKFEKLIARKTKFGGKWVRVLLRFYLTGPSFKTSMYFFYIVALIYTALTEARPEFGFDMTGLGNAEYFLASVRYGALVLIAADRFMERIFIDIKSDEAIAEE